MELTMNITQDEMQELADIEQMKAIVTAVYPDAKLGRTFYKGHHFVGITTMTHDVPTMISDIITLDYPDEPYELAVWANAAEQLVGRA